MIAGHAEARHSPNVEGWSGAPHRPYRPPGQTESSSVSPVTVNPIITAAIGS